MPIGSSIFAFAAATLLIAMAFWAKTVVPTLLHPEEVNMPVNDEFPEDNYCVTAGCSNPPTVLITVGSGRLGQMCAACLDELDREWTRNAKFNAKLFPRSDT